MNMKQLIPLKLVIKQLLKPSESAATPQLNVRKICIRCLHAHIHPLRLLSVSPEKLKRFFKTERTNEVGERYGVLWKQLLIQLQFIAIVGLIRVKQVRIGWRKIIKYMQLSRSEER